METKVISLASLPSKDELRREPGLAHVQNYLVVYDQVLTQYNQFRSWLKQFSLTYPVEAGENLKAIEHFPDHMNFIVEKLINISPQGTCILAVGGGTVGDFSGFVASVFKRGVDLVHIPTTWLAALDSAHGGKNALNVGKLKNQVGTIYPAKVVVLVKELLVGLGGEQCLSAMGELIKMAIIDSKAHLNYIFKSEEKVEEILWNSMLRSIKAKMKLVNKDPFEQKGIRQKLNLGHTLGHAIEAQFRVPHGLAVAQGLYFSVDWSLKAGALGQDDYNFIVATLNKFFIRHKTPDGDEIGNFRVIDLKRILAQDKKLVEESRINFVFVERVGRVEVVKVALNNIIREAVKQGWAV